MSGSEVMGVYEAVASFYDVATLSKAHAALIGYLNAGIGNPTIQG